MRSTGDHPLRYAREAAGFSQNELAVAADLTASTISHIECRHKIAARKTRRRLSAVLKIPEAELFDE